MLFYISTNAALLFFFPQPAKLSCSRKLFEEEEEAQEDGENSNNNSTMPAHSRFSHLALPATTTTSKSSSSSPPSPSTEPELPLPSKLTHLLNVFTHMDFIVSRSKETVTFERLKAKVELATRRTFDRPMLAKVLTVLAIEEKQWFKLKSELLRGSSQLIISAAAVDEQVDEQTSTSSCLNSYQRLLLRKTAFAKSLLEITKRRHLQFLASVGLTAATLSPEKTIFKWHPQFKLDEVDLLPDMSLLPAEKKAVVNNANSILNYFVPVSKTAEAAKAKEEAAEKAAVAATPTPTSTPSKKDVRVKGIRPDLLAKVREKEAARKARLMFRTPETDRKLRLLEQTEPAVRIIASLFTSTAARSFPREKVVKVLADSMKVTSASADALLTYLLSLELLADPTDLDRRWLRPHTSLSDGVSSYIVLQASPRLAFLKEQIARKIAAIKSSD